MKKFITFFPVAILMIGITCSKKTDTAKIEVIEGITYIHNPATPLHPNKTVLFEEELAIASEDEQGNIILFQPGRYAVDQDGNIYISESADAIIKVFDPDGNYIRMIGSKGQGPGEFQTIGDMAFLPDGRLIVMDWRSRRTSIFSPEGNFLHSFQWKNSHFRLYLISDSSLTTDENIYGEKRHLFVKTFDFSGTELVSFGEFTPAEFKILRRDNISFSISLPYAPYSTFAGDRNNQLLYHCMNDNYMIEVFDRNGKLIRKTDRPYVPVPFTDKDAEDYIAGFDEGREQDKVFVDMAKDVPFPKVKTVTERMFVDDDGNLWVQTHEEKEQDGKTYTAYDICNKDGFYDASIWSDITPGLFANGKMYRRHTDEETELVSIKRYRVIWE